MEEKQFCEIKERMDMILKLLTMQQLKGMSTMQATQVLSEVGFKPAEIARLLSKPLNHITSYLSRKKGSTKNKKKGEMDGQ